MSTSRVEVLLWAGRVIAKKDAPPHEVLELKPDCTLEQAQDAFHKLARLAHPDLHRTTLDPTELEKVTSAYAYAAAAYQGIRVAKLRATPAIKPTNVPPAVAAAAAEAKAAERAKRPTQQPSTIRLPGGGLVRNAGTSTRPPPMSGATATAPVRPAHAPTVAPVAPPPPMKDPATQPPTSASSAMNSKALVYYRKAELALRQGDLRTAVLNLKMAIASDPVSPLLRKALIEVETELKGT